jgi:hypothetical protein
MGKKIEIKFLSTDKCYAGIGSRETPEDIQAAMDYIARVLEERGWILRSGGTPGADQAFEWAIQNPENKQIFLPWANFENNDSSWYGDDEFAIEIAKQFHPAYDKLKDGAKKLINRDTYQVLGPKEANNPSKMVICWTENGEEKGETGQAIRIANAYGIPVFNLAIEAHKKKLRALIKKAMSSE